MKCSLIAGVAILAGLANCQSTVTATQTPNASQISKIQADIASYNAGIATQSQVISAVSVISEASATTATIMGVNSANWGAAVSMLNQQVTASAASGVPSDAASIFNSIAAAQASIINKDMSGSAAGISAKSGMLASALVAGGVLAFAGLL